MFQFGADHGQSDNLAVLATVDPGAATLRTGAAVRWAFRYAFGFPNQVYVWQRPHQHPAAVTLPLRTGPALQGVVSNIAGSGAHLTSAGLQVSGKFTLSFARPLVSVGVVASPAHPPQDVKAAALHQPAILDRYPSPQHPQHAIPASGPWFTLSGDLIDALEVEVRGAMLIEAIQFVTLRDTLDHGSPTSWTLLGNANLDPASSNPTVHPGMLQNPAPSQDAVQILEDLFHPTTAAPMATATQSGSSADGGELDVPELGLLLLTACVPSVARQLNLLFDLDFNGAKTAGAHDYVVVGGWPPGGQQHALTGASTLDFRTAGLAGTVYAGDPAMLVSSPNPFVVGPTGLTVDSDGIWLTFAASQSIVQLQLPGSIMQVEATAFARLPGGRLRAVDWRRATDTNFVTLAAEVIDAVSIFPISSAPVVEAVRFSTTDPAAAGTPNATAGSIFAATFGVGKLPLPQSPAPVTAAALPAGDPGSEVRVGVSFNTVGQAVALSAGAASYVISRGSTASNLAVIADPVIVQKAADQPAPEYELIDVVDVTGTGTVTLEYAVAGRDYFGRESARATVGPETFADPVPLPAPYDLTVTVDDAASPATIALAWQWPPPNVDADPRLSGFRIYWAPSSPTRQVTTSPIDAVSQTAGEKGQTFADVPVFHITSELAQGALDTSNLSGTSVQAGTYMYVVDGVEAASGGTIGLRLCVNPSLPAELPAVGDELKIFGKAPDASAIFGPDAYDPTTNVPIDLDAGARSATTATGGQASPTQPVTPWPQPDDHGVMRLNFGVSALGATDEQESAICGPIQAQAVDATKPDPPPVPASVDMADVYTDPVDAFGRSRYTYVADGETGQPYHVFRALDERILEEIYAHQDSAAAPGGQYPSPVQAADFTRVLGQLPAAGEPPLDVGLLPNYDLHLYGNVKPDPDGLGVERAYERLTDVPVVADSDGKVTYTDGSLLGGTINRFMYRLRSVARSGELYDWGWASPPVRLYPEPPVRPSIALVTVDTTAVVIRWTPNPEPEVDAYLLYVTDDPASAQDERLMGTPTLISAEDAGDSGSALLAYTLFASAGAPLYLRLAARATHRSGLQLTSAATDPIAALPHSILAPLAPTDAVAANDTQTGTVTVTFTSSGQDPTARYMLRRRLTGDLGFGTPLTPWTAAATPGAVCTLTDADGLTGSFQYLVAVTNETGAVTYSEPF